MFCEWPLIAISTVSSSPRQLLGGGWTKVTSERRKLDCQSGMHEIPPSNECRLRMVWFNVAVSGVILFGIFSPLSSYSIYYSGFNLFLIFCPLFYSIRWLLKALIKTRAQEYKVGGCKKVEPKRAVLILRKSLISLMEFKDIVNWHRNYTGILALFLKN